ncbi:uncharacterized protein LOC143283286 [Babylonia areolata]|uniref:uncharacterized protein LOC143283286 n=1 Tax=Babylonia areolata TaxID=304850 RepID=UPI003FD4C059
MMMQVFIFCVVGVLIPAVWGSPPPCPVCPRSYSPVCATIRANYGNQCQLSTNGCRARLEGLVTTRQHDGGCPSVVPIRRDAEGFLASLTEKEFAKRLSEPARCPNFPCPMHYDPVCVDYIGNFSNPCVLSSAMCRLGPIFTVTSRRPGVCPPSTQ